MLQNYKLYQYLVLPTDYHHYLEEIEDRPEEGNRKYWGIGGVFYSTMRGTSGIFAFSNTLGYNESDEQLKCSPYYHWNYINRNGDLFISGYCPTTATTTFFTDTVSGIFFAEVDCLANMTPPGVHPAIGSSQYRLSSHTACSDE